MRLRSNQFFFQQADLFEVGPTDLLAGMVHVCICDAQYLRNNISWDEKYRGVRCRSKQHGVWALLMKQFWLGLEKLLAGGILIFRFGWRDPGPEDLATIWYKKCTLRLFTLLYDLFEQVREVKSDYFNALQSSFYVCCSNFDRAKFEDRQVAKVLGNMFNYLVTTDIQDSNELEILAHVDKIRTEEVDRTISDMLDRVDRLRIINQESRRWHRRQEEMQEDSRAVVFVSPVPRKMTNQELADFFAVYGHVIKIDRDGDLEASIQFAKVEAATTAVLALRTSPAFGSALGEGVRVWIREEEIADRPNDTWSQEWATGPSAPAAAKPSPQVQVPPGFGAPCAAGSAATPTPSPQDAASASTHAAPVQASSVAAGPTWRSQGGGKAANGGEGASSRQNRPKGKGSSRQSSSGYAPTGRQQPPPATASTVAPATPAVASSSPPPRPQRRGAPEEERMRGWGAEDVPSVKEEFRQRRPDPPPSRAALAAEEPQEPMPQRPRPPSSQAVEQQVQQEQEEPAGEADGAAKPSLHPALQDHQARTKELIAQLLKAK